MQAHCQSRTSQHYNQSFVKELAKPTQRKIVFKKFSDPFKKNKKRKRTVLNRTDIASNVNRFVESVCGHEQLCFVGTAPHAANIRLKEIIFLRALFGERTEVFIINGVA